MYIIISFSIYSPAFAVFIPSLTASLIQSSVSRTSLLPPSFVNTFAHPFTPQRLRTCTLFRALAFPACISAHVTTPCIKCIFPNARLVFQGLAHNKFGF